MEAAEPGCPLLHGWLKAKLNSAERLADADLCTGKAVSNDDRDALASHTRNRIQFDRDDRGKEDRRDFPFVARAATSPTLLLLPSWMPEEKSESGTQRPIRMPVVREASIELMIERSLPSSRGAHAAHGAACLVRQLAKRSSGAQSPRGIRRQIQQQPAFRSEANTLPPATAAANPILHRRNRDAREGNVPGRSRRSDSEVLAKHVKSVSAAPCSG
jgi:hypothetical protein